MKDEIFKFILVTAICLSTYGCGLFRKAQKPSSDENLGVPAMYGQTVMYNARQLDSMCVVDGISSDLSKWVSMAYYDFETQERIDRYAFIKVLNENEEMTYILTPVDTLYKITKRFIKEVEEDE
jgi:hypothetical protein